MRIGYWTTDVVASYLLVLALVVYRFGTRVPVPVINRDALADLVHQNQNCILGLFNMFSGAALERFSVFVLGIMPYISASIIMQLMAVVVPTLEAIKKEGESGRRKITQYNRYGRSEERRVGKECVRTGRSRWSPCH